MIMTVLPWFPLCCPLPFHPEIRTAVSKQEVYQDDLSVLSFHWYLPIRIFFSSLTAKLPVWPEKTVGKTKKQRKIKNNVKIEMCPYKPCCSTFATSFMGSTNEVTGFLSPYWPESDFAGQGEKIPEGEELCMPVLQQLQAMVPTILPIVRIRITAIAHHII